MKPKILLILSTGLNRKIAFEIKYLNIIFFIKLPHSEAFCAKC